MSGRFGKIGTRAGGWGALYNMGFLVFLYAFPFFVEKNTGSNLCTLGYLPPLLSFLVVSFFSFSSFFFLALFFSSDQYFFRESNFA